LFIEFLSTYTSARHQQDQGKNRYATYHVIVSFEAAKVGTFAGPMQYLCSFFISIF
jgi:hypothetical protein